MHCPACEQTIDWAFLQDDDIEANQLFECPHCEEALRYQIDEGTYLGAQHITIEVVDE
ncbi:MULTISPECIES: hypothetical protein [unclassified Vibrio]|uniref:CPXCG motif-containing cysteine-rich protein n=1 Tax=Vibrio sp. HB236076 TaxID=3232307 RepID=A0AB39HDM4_9VIBR|nr:hypothetical protein [Vibrio sp. HB161653]MDP5253443.1 hypothetical protein [Vibrio sp. HB161653]